MISMTNSHQSADDQRLEANRRSWNAATVAHLSHRGGMAAFLRGGGSTLFADERDLLGDVAGQRVLHLQCHTGEDTLSLAQLGAVATGVDLSDVAIAAARDLAQESGIDASFVCAEVCDWLEAAARAGTQTDVVFASYGVICWHDDLQRFMNGIAGVLSPGGRFVLVEFHPIAAMFDADWQFRFAYGDGRALHSADGVGDYVGASGDTLTPGGFDAGTQEFRNPWPAHLHQWGLGDVVSAVAAAGLRVEVLRELPWLNGERAFNRMQTSADGDRRLRPPSDVPELPLLYALSAQRTREAASSA